MSSSWAPCSTSRPRSSTRIVSASRTVLKPVCDDEGRPPGEEVVEVLLDRALGLGVERARRLVEQQHRRLRVDGARDRDALRLAAGEPQARLAHLRLVAEREPLDEAVGGRHAGGPAHARAVGAVVAERDVARDRVVEQVAVLKHEADLPAQRAVVERAQVDAVVVDRPLGRLEQPREALDQRRLAGAAAPDDRDASVRARPRS